MSSTPKPPQTEGKGPNPTPAPDLSLEHTILGVGTAPRPLGAPPAPARPLAPPLGLGPAARAASSARAGAVASLSQMPLPSREATGTDLAKPSAGTQRAALDRTASYGSPPPTGARGVMRQPFPKPPAYAIPPRAGDASRAHQSGERTTLTADYLRAAREAAFAGRSAPSQARSEGELRPSPPSSGAAQPKPAPWVVAPRPAAARESARPFASDPPNVRDASPQHASGADAKRGVSQLPAAELDSAELLPPLPEASPEESATRDLPELPGFEPVLPVAHTLHGGESAPRSARARDAGAAHRGRASARAGSRSSRSRALLMALAVVALGVLGFALLRAPIGGTLARLLRPVASQLRQSETPASGAAPATATLANQPAEPPASEVTAGPTAPSAPIPSD